MQNRTVMVIAHRLSTVVDADVIAVCGQGRVLAAGTHAQLMRTSEVYTNLVRRQLQWGERDDTALVQDSSLQGGSTAVTDDSADLSIKPSVPWNGTQERGEKK